MVQCHVPPSDTVVWKSPPTNELQMWDTRFWAASVNQDDQGSWTGQNMLICLPHPECWWPSALKERPNVLHIKTGCWWGRQKWWGSDETNKTVLDVSSVTQVGFKLLLWFYIALCLLGHICFYTFRLRLVPWTVGLDYSTDLLSEWGNA